MKTSPGTSSGPYGVLSGSGWQKQKRNQQPAKVRTWDKSLTSGCSSHLRNPLCPRQTSSTEQDGGGGNRHSAELRAFLGQSAQTHRPQSYPVLQMPGLPQGWKPLLGFYFSWTPASRALIEGERTTLWKAAHSDSVLAQIRRWQMAPDTINWTRLSKLPSSLCSCFPFYEWVHERATPSITVKMSEMTAVTCLCLSHGRTQQRRETITNSTMVLPEAGEMRHPFCGKL